MKSWPLITLAALVAVAVVAACGGDEETKCNGHEELCDRALNEVTLATTHNSMSAKSEPGWSLEAHDTGIREQLEGGIRGFQIDVYTGLTTNGDLIATNISDEDQKLLEEKLGPDFAAAAILVGDLVVGVDDTGESGTYLCHAFCELGATKFTTALEWYRDFLEDNPNEVITIFIEDYVPEEDVEAAFEEAGLSDYVFTYSGGDWPTLREMIDSGERVLVMSEHGGGIPAWYHEGFELTQETHYRYETIEAMDCRPNRGEPDSPLFQLNSFISPPNRELTETVNSYDFLLARGEACRDERGLQPNLLAVNFWEIGDVVRVADALNGVE